MMKDFREFIMRGNVMDLAVGVIIGAAFGAIVNSLVNDVIMPPIGLALGNVDFTNLFIVLKEGAKASAPYATIVDAQAAGAVTLNYGTFFTHVVSFVILAFVVFMMVRAVNRLKQAPPAAPAAPTTKACPYCLSAIPLKASRCAHCTSEVKAA
jgi:large conductance mechanosensitive channel